MNNVSLKDIFDTSNIDKQLYFMEKYLHEPLVLFFEQLLQLKPNAANIVDLQIHKQRLKIVSIIGILCNICNQSSNG